MYSEDSRRKKKKYYQEHKDEILQKRKKHYETNKDEIFKYKEKYRETHREAAKEYAKTYRARNKKETNEKSKKEQHIKIKKETSEKQKNKNKECQRRRTRRYKMLALNTISDVQGNGIKCWRCGESRPWVLTIGHVLQNGKEDRKKNGTGTQYYKKIFERVISCRDLQIECVSCNYAQFRYKKYPDELTAEYIAKDINTSQRNKAYKKIAEDKKTSIKCWRCGEENIEKLTIGHIYNDGKVERKEKGYNLKKFYREIEKGTRPTDDLTIECFNCNMCREWYNKYPDELSEKEFSIHI